MTWRRLPLEEILPKGGIFDGPFGSNLKTSDYTTSGVRVIRLENVGKLRFIAEKESFISRQKYASLNIHTVGEGDIIFASFIDDGIRACILPLLQSTAIAKADCFCLRPRADMVVPCYLAYQLVSQESYDPLIEEVHGATRPRINTTQLRRLKVTICPINEQKEIVTRVELYCSVLKRIEDRYWEVASRVNELPEAVLAQAFRGELVPTEADLARLEGREYEPASELLQRMAPTRRTRISRNPWHAKHEQFGNKTDAND